MKSKAYRIAFVKNGELKIVDNDGNTIVLNIEILLRTLQESQRHLTKRAPDDAFCGCFMADVPLTLVDGKCSQCGKPSRS